MKIDKVDNIKENGKEVTEQARTTKKKEAFLNGFEELVGIISATCQKIGINRNTYYDWMSKDEDFSKKVEVIKDRQVGMVEDRLIRAILNDNITAIIFYLKSKHPSYASRLKIQGKVEATKELTDEQKNLIKLALQYAKPEDTIKGDNGHDGGGQGVQDSDSQR